MIPNLTLMIGAYLFVRLLDIMSEHYDNVEDSKFSRNIFFLAMVAIVIVVVSTASTILAGAEVTSLTGY